MELFNKIRPDLLAEVEQLCIKHNFRLFDRIKNERDELNLKSLLTEAHFGIFFDRFDVKLQYDSEFIIGSNLTPDFQVTLNNQEIIAEVCRVNPAQKDMDAQKLEDEYFAKLKEEDPEAEFIGNFHPITWKIEKINGENGVLSQKANKYGPWVNKAQVPFLICISTEFTSALDSLDIYNSLYGGQGEYIGEFDFGGYSPGALFYEIGQGLFYRNKEMRDNVSGVLFRDFSGEFVYYHNYSNRNRLSKENIDFFLEFQYPHN